MLTPYRLLLSGLLMAVVLSACARAPETTKGSASVSVGSAPQGPAAEKPVGVVDEVRPAMARTVQVPAPGTPADPPVMPEHLPAQEFTQGLERLRVSVVRRGGKYPLVRREEVLGRGPGGQQVVSVREMVADHMLVSLAPGQTAGTVAAAIGGEVRRVMPGGRLALIAFPYSAHADYGLYRDRIAAQPGVSVAEPDYLVRSIGTPNDSGFASLWGMNNTGQTGGTPDADIDAPEAWNISTGSKAVLVGVIDTGIDRNHVDLAANMWTNPGEMGLDVQGNPKATNGIDDDGNGYVDDWRGWDFVNNDNDPTDDQSHGTHCAGTIGAVGGNGQGVAGVCWNVSLVGLKFLNSTGNGAISDAVEAQLYANSIGCDLTSNSWGGGGFSQAMLDAITAAAAQGHLFVAAAGNATSDNDAVASYPSNYVSPNVIAVAATTHTDGLAWFSNYGATTVHLGAPGENIYSCQPGNLYQNLSGTSMATPHVAGACALLKSANPLLTGPQIKAAILAQVDPVSALAGKTITGGRLNLHRALLSVSGAVVVQDALVSNEIGNGDGLVNPGESVDLAITLANQGSQGTTGVAAVLTTSDPYVTIPQATATYGELLPGGKKAGSTAFRVAIAAGCPTPRTIALTLTVSGGGGGPWAIPVAITTVTSAQLSGVVRRIGNSSPIAGATVAWTGAQAGNRTTNAQGQFSTIVPAGTYQVVASATGLKAGTPVTATLPGLGSLILTLGAPAMAVSPTTVALSAAVPSAQVQIANAGDAALVWQATTLGTAQTSGLWHTTTYRTATGAGTSWYYGKDATHNYDTGAANSGALVFNGVTVPSAQPNLTFVSWRKTEGGSTYDRSDVQVSTDGGLTWATLTATSPTRGVARDGAQVQVVGPNVWTGLFQEVDNTATWHPVSVNLAAYAGQTVALRFWFDTIDSAGNTYEGWYVDDVALGGTPLSPWLSLSVAQGTVAAGASATVTLAANLADAPNGTSTSTAVFTGDVPGGASASVAATLTKVGTVGPKIAVTPSSLALTTPTGGTASATLSLTNPGDAPLNFTVTTPSGGGTATGLWHQTTNRTLNGNQVWWYGDEVKKTYDTGTTNSGALVYSGISVPAGTPALTWQQWRVTEGTGTSWDKSLVQVSTNGTVWTTLVQVVDNDALWHSATASLATYAGQTVSIRFFFDTVDSGANAYEGWYVGDVRVAGGALGQPWLTAAPISGTVAPGASATVTVQAVSTGLAAGSYASQVTLASNASTGNVIVPVSFQITSPAKLVFGSQSFTDVGTLPYVGDADGFAEPGEKVRWNVPLINSGSQTATGVNVALSSTSPWVSFPTPSVAVGTIPGLGAATAVLPIAIASGCPSGTTIPVAVNVTYGQGSVLGSSSFLVQVKSRISGTITDFATGLPLSGVTVTAGGVTNTTGATGTYLIPALSAGSYSVTYSKADYVGGTSTVVLPPDVMMNITMGFRDLTVSPGTLAVQLSRGQSAVQNLVLQTTGSLPTTWSVLSSPAWLTLSPTGALQLPGTSQTVAATFQTGSLGNGTYSGSLTLSTNASKGGLYRTVGTTLTIRSATAPTAGPLAITLAEDSPTTFTLPGMDGDGDSLTYAILTQPTHGVVNVTALGQATYTPVIGYYGADSFTWRVSDGYDVSPTATVALTITHQNHSPIFSSTGVEVAAGATTTFTVPVSDRDGDPLTINVVQPIRIGSLAITGVQAVYTPPSGFLGQDVVRLDVSDGQASTGTVTLRINVVADPAQSRWPTLGNGPEHRGWTSAGLGTSPLVPLWSVPLDQPGHQPVIADGRVYVTARSYNGPLRASAYDVATGTQIWTRLLPAGATLNPPTWAAGSLYFQRGNNGADSQLYKVDAATGTTQWTAAYLEQWDHHLAPTVVGDRVWINGGTYGGLYGFNATTGAQLFYVNKPQYDQWTPTWTDTGILAWAGNSLALHDGTTGTATWSTTLPIGASSYQYGAPVADTGRIYIVATGGSTLYAVDRTTQAVTWSRTGTYWGMPALADGHLFVPTSAGIEEVDAATGTSLRIYATSTLYANATSSVQPIVTVDSVVFSSTSSTYLFTRGITTPRQQIAKGGFASLAGGRLFVADGIALAAYALPNQAPMVTARTLSVRQGQMVQGVLWGADPEGALISWSIAGVPAHGTASVVDGLLTYQSSLDFAGTDSVLITAFDGSLVSVPTAITITVIPDQAPVAVPATVTLAEDGSAAIVLSGTDADGDALTVEVLSGPQHGSSTAVGGIWSGTYTPAADWNGTDAVVYRVLDGVLASAPATISLVVTPVNDAPSWTPGSDVIRDSDLGPALLPGWATAISVGPANEVDQAVAFLVTNDRPDLFLQQPAIDALGRLSFAPVAGATGIATLGIVIRDDGGTTQGGIDQLPPVVRTLTLATYLDAELTRESQVSVGLTASATQVAESAGVVTLTLSRSGDLVGDLPVTVQVGGTATGGVDYNILPTLVTLPAGSATATLPLTIQDDALPENPETIIITVVPGPGYVPDSATRSVTVTIADDEPLTVSLAVADGTMAEPGDSGAFRVSRSGPITTPLVVNLAWEGTADAADVVALPASATIPANSAALNVVITPVDDAIAEEVETLICRLVPSATYAIGTATATINLQDNEPEVVEVVASVAVAAEPGLPGTFRILRRGSTAIARTLAYTMSGTAVAGTDYPTLGGTATLAIGVSSTTVTLIPSNDATVEQAETAILTLTPVAGVTLGTASATVTILDNDGTTRPIVSLTTADGAADEVGGTGTFTISRTGSTVADLLVRFQSVSGSAMGGVDYQALPATVTIPAGKASMSLTVQPIDDAVAEPNETVGLALAADPTYFVSTSRSGTVTITDNDPLMLTLTLSDNKAMEPGTDTGRFTISRTGPVTAALTVPVVIGGTAQAGIDYLALPSVVTIPVGAASASLVVTALEDAVAEPDETVILRILPNAAYTIAGSPAAIVTIGDDEAPVVEALAFDSQAMESGDKAVIRLNRLGSRTAALTVALAWSGSAGNGTDVNALPASATIAAGSGWTDLTITPRQDTTVEPIETVVATVLPGTGYTVGGSASAVIALADDDAGQVTIAPVLVEADEWDLTARTVEVVRSGSCATGITVAYTVTGSARVAEPAGVRQVFLPAGVERAVLRISPHPDDRSEGTETVVITIQAGSGYTLGAATSATVNLHESPGGGG